MKNRDLSIIPKGMQSIMPIEIDTSTQYGRIEAYYTHGLELKNQDDIETRKRWLTIWGLLCEGISREDVVKEISTTSGLSIRTIQRDVQHSLQLHGDAQEVHKKAMRHIVYNMALKVFNKSLKQDDLKAANAALKNMISAYGLDKEDAEKIDWENLQAHEIKFVISKKLKPIIDMAHNSGAFDLDAIFPNIDMELDE